MYSGYKGRETYKALVGITPSGSISFVSHGRLSGRKKVERSGLLHRKIYNEGDEIMADKGFEIRYLTDKIGVQLNLPIVLGSRSELSIKKMLQIEYTWRSAMVPLIECGQCSFLDIASFSNYFCLNINFCTHTY